MTEHPRRAGRQRWFGFPVTDVEPACDIRPLITVVVPHLNEPVALRDCLYALERQRTPDLPFEVIVVDNGSAVLPTAICDEFGDTRLERELVPGPGAARNRGAELARADIIAFVDADCRADAGWIGSIHEFFQANPAVDVLGGDIRVLRSGSPKHRRLEAYEDLYSYRARLFVERDGYAATGNMAVRTSVFRAVGGFGGIGTYEDMMWGRKATSLGFRIAFVPQMIVSTAACRTFDELKLRLDRLAAHGFRDFRHRPGGMARWVLRSFAMAASPLAEIGRIATTDRLSGIDERLQAFGCLLRVRLYRARRMLALACGADAYRMVARWNRS